MSYLLGRTVYNPDPVVTRTATGATATDFDATNLAVTFTVPSNGRVLAILNGYSFSAGTAPDNRITYWNLREGLVDVFPVYRMHDTIDRTRYQLSRLITGLTAGEQKTYKWGGRTDLATTGTSLQIGTGIGPAFMEIWEAPASKLLTFVEHNPDPATTYTNPDVGVVTDVDATNLAVTFTVPDSGKVCIEMEAIVQNRQQWLIREGTTTVNPHPIAFNRQATAATDAERVNVRMMFEGLTAGASKTWKWAWQSAEANDAFLYAGTNYGAAAMRVWAVTT